jgi:hypothetical protein
MATNCCSAVVALLVAFQTASATDGTSATASSAATRWVEHSLDVVRDEGIDVGRAGRLYAMTFAAIYDAVNGIERARHESRREHAIVSPSGAPTHADPRVAAAAAAHAVLVGLAPNQKVVLDAALNEEIKRHGGPFNQSVYRGQRWGAFVGEQVVFIRSSDGSSTPDTLPARTGIGEHRTAFNASLSHLAPFGIDDAAPYVSPPPPALTSEQYAAAYDDVKVNGVQDGDVEHNEISDFWLAGTGTVTETGTWVQAALAIVRRQGTVQSLSATSRLFALLGMATGDAVLVSWKTKALYFTWRPTVAIREGELDGNALTQGDPAWTSRIGSAGGSPEYTSGTSTLAGAAARVLAGFYCRDSIRFSFQSDGASSGARAYRSFSQGAAEAGRSRIFQGIHFEFSNQEGQRVGRLIGNEIVHERLRRLGSAPSICPQS